MKRILLSLLFILILVPVSAQNEQQEMMKAWQEYMTPGPMHKMLASYAGNWKSEIKQWMDPSQPPITTEGTSVNEAILGGRYLMSKHKADVMGMPMDGIEVIGYDNAKKKFVTTWMDNMGTGIMFSEGTMDEETNTITYSGVSTDPMGNEVKIIQKIKYIDNDNTSMEMFMDMGDGKEIKNMEMKSTRVK
jgi:hypothetical protein